jgi:hypothetical protein
MVHIANSSFDFDFCDKNIWEFYEKKVYKVVINNSNNIS